MLLWQQIQWGPMTGRCAPLCQHPGCWGSARTEAPRATHTQYNNYIQELLRSHSFPAARARTHEAEDGLPVLTVQSLAMEGISSRGSTEITRVVTSQDTHPHPVPFPPTHPPQLHNVEVILEKIESSSCSSLSFSPVLIWRPGRLPMTSPTERLLGRSKARGKTTMTTQNLTDTLPPERPSTGSRRKAMLYRPHSKLHSESLDFLQDMPPYMVTEILQQLYSKSSSTFTSRTSPHHLSHHSPTPLTTPTSTLTQHATTDGKPDLPDSCHVPSSLVCDLSTGQLYRNDHSIQTAKIPPRLLDTSHHPPPPPPAPAHPPALAAAQRRITVAPSQRKRALPPVCKKTSFSRELSRSPLSVLHKTESTLLHSHQQHSTNIHTINQTTLPPAPPPSLHTHPPSHHHCVRYPLGNPVVPRTPHDHSLNPLLAPYHRTHLRHRRDSKGPETSFLHMSPANVGSTRLVTLHCVDRNSTGRQDMTELATPSAEVVALMGPKDTRATVHLPPIPSSPPHTPSPSPPPPPATCMSPDHMHMGAAIQGDQLVLEREGEQVVHPLRDTSHISMGGTGRPEATPSEVGVASGIQAPPPTARESES